jgi:hypothetical protein
MLEDHAMMKPEQVSGENVSQVLNENKQKQNKMTGRAWQRPLLSDRALRKVSLQPPF